MIYGFFVLVSWHWLPLLVLGGWTVYFFINMAKKDNSMARHEGFTTTKQLLMTAYEG